MKTIGEANAAAIAAATAISKKKSGNYDKKGFRKTPYKNPEHPNVKSNEERRKEMNEDYNGGKSEQVAGSAQSTLTDKPNKEPMKTYKDLKNITELSTDLLHRYKEKAAADSAKADKEGDVARGNKRFSGVVKATNKQFAKFKKKGFNEDITKKPDAFKALKPKESEHETYYKFVTGKAKIGKPLSNKEKDFVKSYKLMKQEQVEQIDEISAQAHKEYQAAARKDVAALAKHTGGEYGDIAKNIMKRRMKGLSTSTALQHRDTMMKVKKEEVEQINEISKSTLGSYVKKASLDMANRSAGVEKDLSAAKSDYNMMRRKGTKKTIAQNMMKKDVDTALSKVTKVSKRMSGIEKATNRLTREEVEQLEENAMHGTVYLHKYHEGPSEDSYGEVGKDHTQHAYKVYHKKPGGKPNLIGDTENNVHNKTKKTAHAVARNDEMEYDHKSHNDAVRHVMDAAGVHPSTPVRYIKDKKQMNEEVEQIVEKNVPTSPEKWAQAKAQAKAKFDVYPSAYANGWAAKKYKAMGGGWKSVSEETEQIDEEGYKARSDAKIAMAARASASRAGSTPPFEGGTKTKDKVIPGKYGKGYSTARHLARMAMQKQVEKMKKAPIKESRKAAIVKDIMKKKKSSEDAFQKDPELSSTLTKMQ